MDKKTEKYCEILSKLENQILDIGSCFNIAILTTGDELGKYYEDECYYTNVIVRRDFTATVNQHRKGDEDLPPDEEFPPDVDKDLIPESKCWDLSKREVSTYLAAIISPWFESFLSKMKQGIDTLLGLGVTCPSAIESLGLLKIAYDRGEEVFSEFKQKNDPLDFVGEFEMYLSCYCGVNEIGKRFEELQKRMGLEPVELNSKKDLLKKKQSAIRDKDCWHNEDFTTVIWYGTEYQFNKTQARCIKYLWENNSASENSIGEILDSAACNGYRLRDTFRSKTGYHCAWKKMIISAGKGCFKLNKSQS